MGHAPRATHENGLSLWGRQFWRQPPFRGGSTWIDTETTVCSVFSLWGRMDFNFGGRMDFNFGDSPLWSEVPDMGATAGTVRYGPKCLIWVGSCCGTTICPQDSADAQLAPIPWASMVGVDTRICQINWH